MASSYTVERLLSYSSIIQALHGGLLDMNLITDASYTNRASGVYIFIYLPRSHPM